MRPIRVSDHELVAAAPGRVAAWRLEIEQGTGTVLVRSREHEPESWIVTLRRR